MAYTIGSRTRCGSARPMVTGTHSIPASFTPSFYVRQVGPSQVLEAAFCRITPYVQKLHKLDKYFKFHHNYKE